MKRGFTLIEIIVALMIFTIVAVVALAALVKIVDANKKAQTTQDAVLGLSFALEAMSREIRTATNIHCEAVNTTGVPISYSDQACIPAGHNQLIVFKSANLDTTSPTPCRLRYAYWFSAVGSTYTLKKAQQSKGNNCSDVFSSDMYGSIAPTSVSITNYSMAVSPANLSVGPFPIVFVGLSGYAGSRDRVKTFFNVQTAVSQRSL